MIVTTFGFGQDRSDTFVTLSNVIQPAVPAGFVLNNSQSWDNRLSYKLSFDGEGSEMNRLIFSLSPETQEFSEMDLALDHSLFTWQGRKGLFLDGSQTRMSGLLIILKDNAGKFSLTHRNFESPAMTKEELETLLKKIELEKLENL
jgi:hypothetical protein